MIRETCTGCFQVKSLRLGSRKCRSCLYSKAHCLNCEQHKKIIVDGLCYGCYQDRQVLKELDVIEKNFIAHNDYNLHLFKLYLTYIKRYRLTYPHKVQAEKLTAILSHTAISPIHCWYHVSVLSQNYPIYQKPNTSKGSAFIKIGHMLQELGIIEVREDEFEGQRQNKLKFFKDEQVKLFLQNIDKLKTAKETTLKYLNHLSSLQEWLATHNKIQSLLKVNRSILENYFGHIKEQNENPYYAREVYLHVRRFYKWCHDRGHINLQIFPNIPIKKVAEKLPICDEAQFKKLFAYLKNPASCPENAFLLVLILIYGFTTQDLSHAKILLDKDHFSLLLRRKVLTKGRKYYNREEVLALARTPQWFFDLQRRFLEDWIKHYEKVKKTYPHRPLLLPKHNHYNRDLSTCTTRLRLKKATQEALGMKIPIKVLRQTCGHLHTIKSDASMLSRLGWSSSYSFHYTWLPRVIFS